MDSTVDVVDLENKIVSEYHRKLDLGRMIKRIVQENNVPLPSLNKERMEALKLFEEYADVKYVEWRPWQKKMLEYLHNPTQRRVIWVVGEKGNEGKTFFQDQIQDRYGMEKVCKMHFGGRSENIMNYLHGNVSMTTDIFLFHTHKNVCVKELDYQLVENIKDGWTMSTDYGDDIHFKRSNVIIVFSNKYPDIQRLSEDKWMIFKINNKMELKHVTHYINGVKINKRKKMIIESDESEDE